MPKEYYLCLDIGGTEIKGNVLNGDLAEYFSDARKFPSKSRESKTTILENFEGIIKSQLQIIKKENGRLIGIGFAFPGPFDYLNGISLMKNLRKYDAIYQVSLLPYIHKWLVDMDFPMDVPILFENDAIAFSLGEYLYGTGMNKEKVMFIMLGTGCGSTFIENGLVIKNQYGLDESGMIYKDPFLAGTIEDYLSAKGLRTVARKLGIQETNGLALSKAAQKGSEQASRVFYEFGQLIGTALKPYVENFKPDRIVFGGQIAKSLNWMEEGIHTGIHPEQTTIIASQSGTASTFKGLVHLLNKI